jgi:hypothetical protein
MFKLHDQNPSHFKWISYVKSIFDDTGLSFIWNDQIPMGKNASNIKFPIETGRWNGVPKHERICNLCGNGIGDEFHYLFICEKQEIKTIREKFIPIYYTKYPTELKLSRMFMYCHVELYKNLASFLKIMMHFL